MGIKWIIKKYYEQLYYTFNNLHEIDQFLGREKLSNLTKREIHILKKPISIK